MPSKSIMIVDDDLSMTLNLEEILTNSNYELAGSAHSGEEALKMARQCCPDLVLMDIELGRGMDGIEVAEQLHDELNISCIFVTGHDDGDLIERAKNCRPLGYILKPLNERQLLANIELAFSEIEARNKLEDFNEIEYSPALAEKYPDLTPTELRIAYQISKGRSTKEVAESLSISETTVQWHRKNIRKKLNFTHTDKNLTLDIRF